MSSISSIVVAHILCLLALYYIQPLARRHKLLDYPTERKDHGVAVPIVGGVVLYLVFVFASLTLDISLAEYRCFFAMAGLIVITGFLDDLKDIRPRTKLIAITVGALAMIYWGDTRINDLGTIFSSEALELGYLSTPFTIFATVGFINSFNLMDGIDGLAGSLAVIALAFLAYIALDMGNYSVATLSIILISVTIAFLCFNARLPWNKSARMYLGDSGSLFLGFAIAWLGISLFRNGGSTYPPIVVLWIFAIPVYDALRVAIYRISDGKHPFNADKNHIHHILRGKGFTVNMTLITILSLSVACAEFGIISVHYGLSESTSLLLYVMFFVIYFATINRIKQTSASFPEKSTAKNVSESA